MSVESRRQFLDDVFDSFSMLAGGHYVSLYDNKAKLTRYSPGAVELFGLPGEYIEDGAYDWVDYVHPEDQKRYQHVMQAMMEGKTLSYDLAYRVRLRDGSYAMFRFIGSVIRSEAGEPSLVGGMMINEGLMENTDPITVLRNQYGFFSDLGALIHMRQRCVILLIGFSRMARINATHGYGFGNRLLQQVGWAIQEIAGEEGVVYRMERSRFAFLTRTLSEEQVADIYRKIRQKLLRGVSVDGVLQNLATNGGMILVDDFSISERTVYTGLHYAYQESKDRKHGALVSFSGIATMDTRRTLQMLHAIRNSMIDECQGFSLRYQPVKAVRTGRVIGAEALVFWEDAVYGTVLPEQFIPILQHDFSFEELGVWILRRAMQDALHFLEKDPDFVLGVNLAPSQLEDDMFRDSVIEVASQTGFPIGNLCLELTRDCRMMDLDHLRESVEDLQKLGVRILVDDFGTGYASLESLRELHADYVKFDMRFVRDIEADEKAREYLHYLSELAAVEGCNVCVKGIESGGMLDIIRHYPINSMQGYYIMKPMTIAQALEGDAFFES